MSFKRTIAVDTETDLIGQPDVIPQLVCSTWSERGEKTLILGSSPDELQQTSDILESLLDDPNVRLVFHNDGYDLAVFAVAFPDLITLIFQALEDGRIDDTGVREKLLNLSTHGHIAYVARPDGSNAKLFYGLADLVMKYTGVDRFASKEGDDIWRMNYYTLLGVPAKDYPEDARAYAMTDSDDTLDVFDLQEERIQGITGVASCATSPMRAAVMFAFQLMTAWGLKIDQVEVERIDLMLHDELSPENLSLLIEGKFLTLATPEMPYKNGAKDKDGNPKVKKAQPAKMAAKKLKAYVCELCERKGIPIKMTEPTEANPEGQVCLDKEVQATLATLDPLMKQYQHRQILNKLVTDFMPKLRTADTIHPQFGVLVETGRSSSSASDLYPSCNGQQVDPRVRNCFVARPGQVLMGADYSAVELVGFGQKCYELFGYSTHRDLINAGNDLHSYLAAQLLTHLPLDPEFTDAFLRGTNDPMELHDAFKALEHNHEPFLDRVDAKGQPVTVADVYSKWRQFSKAPGFGLIGGMGVARFQEFCRKDYGIEVTDEEAKAIKDIWLATYPEAKAFFDHVKRNLGDPNNVGRDKETGKPKPKFAYTSPMGMYRAGADYCAAANGEGCQTRVAEGAVGAVFAVARECYDPSLKSILYGCHPLLFIHDELIVEGPLDDKAHDRAMRLAEIMVECMKKLIPDVLVEAVPCLSLIWDKKAEPVYDSDDRLIVWQPKKVGAA